MKTQCPECKAKFNVSEQSIGKKAKCPKCAQGFTIEPFAETPVEAPAKIARPSVGTPTKIAEPVKAAQPPVETSAKNAKPIKAADISVKEKPESKRLSKTAYVYCWAGARIIAGIFGFLGLMLALRKEADSTLIATFAAGNVFLLCSVLIELTLLYKMWSAIQDGEASVTAAKAVGFLFVPVFNIYWALYMVTGFAEDYNAFVRRHSAATKDLPLVLFFVYAVVFLLSATVVITPFVCALVFAGLIRKAFVAYHLLSCLLFFFALAAGISHFIIYILFAIKTCSAINALPSALAEKS